MLKIIVLNKQAYENKLHCSNVLIFIDKDCFSQKMKSFVGTPAEHALNLNHNVGFRNMST